MPTGQYALAARIELARRAERTLDVQYYQIHDDRTGRYVLRTLRDAASRGVRALIDDLYTAGADPLFLGLDAHANVEVRLFNPFPAGRQNLITRFAALGARLQPGAPAHAQQAVHRRRRDRGRRRPQHRRRILHGERRRQLHRPRHARRRCDRAALSALFDEYWNSPRTFPIDAIVPPDASPEALRAAFDAMTGPETRRRRNRRRRTISWATAPSCTNSTPAGWD